MTVSGGSIACDIGPPYTGAIPAAATQAGFTTCAANYDFTYTGSFTDDVGTHQWSNLPTWFSCSGTIGAPYLWRNRGAVACDTSHQNIQMDGNVQVLALTYYLSDWNAGHYNNYMSNEAPGVTPDPGDSLPQQGYIEFVARQSSTSGNCAFNSSTGTSFCALFGLSTFTDQHNTPDWIANDLEFDDSGVAQTVTGLGLPPWGPDYTAYGYGPVTNNDMQHGTSYTTMGQLVTADGVSAYGGCDYGAAAAVYGLQKSSFGSCLTNGNGFPVSNGKFTVVPPGSSSGSSSVFGGVQIHEYFSQGPNVGTNGMWVSSSNTTYIQRLTRWECAGWKTGPCITNPVVTTAPP